MNLIYKQLVFPFEQTNLERILDKYYFKINLVDHSQQVNIHLENDMMLLEFSKSIKAACGKVRDFEKRSYIPVAIDLEAFVAAFNNRYKLDATIEVI